MTDITNKIKAKLEEIEQRENIHILYACESGSRAWGFASPDSDYDVRFVFIRPLEEYLRIDSQPDYIDCELNEIYDINGWDLRKFFQHLFNSNPVTYEWANSPIVYKTSDKWEKIKDLMKEYFLESTMIYHYLGIAKTNIKKYFKGDEIILKKYFYVLRPVLAAEWILNKKNPPPTEYSKLIASSLSQEDIYDIVEMENWDDYDLEKINSDLLAKKNKLSEKQTIKRNKNLEMILQNKIKIITNITISGEKENTDWNKLNKEFWEVING